jgi:hypothetical protein
MQTLTDVAEVNLGLFVSGLVAFTAAWALLWLFFRGIDKQTHEYRAGELAIIRRREVLNSARNENRDSSKR